MTFNRRDFIKTVPALGAAMGISAQSSGNTIKKVAGNDRQTWLNLLYKISHPVLDAMSQGKLTTLMPVEVPENAYGGRDEVTYLEAIGRLLAGLAPWLELEGVTGEEAEMQKELREKALLSIKHSVDPDSPDYINWTKGAQPLVDGAFLVHGIMRAPKQLWEPLDAETKARLVKELIAQKLAILPYYNNWILFGAMIDAFLFSVGEQGDLMRMDFAIKKHMEWYAGDGWYGDGSEFHLDYYNSYVIQPMLIQVLEIAVTIRKSYTSDLEKAKTRMQRYSRQLEMLISPEGTYPAIGRSICYRSGAFQPLAEVVLKESLPEEITNGQVRSALTAVYSKLFSAKGTFDENGWLQLGLAGHQPGLAEPYISTGSLYLCSLGFLPLGLPANHDFWTAQAEDWTSVKIWNGEDMERDSALK
ncbi:DUF2264 domain-containing protein [Algoriphagus machipongonensis]|uniref:Tat (Twin-arginine translocation) pathway signal sequence containing protein n=1 Tax=Algoriphagus machipongonensis TaxID=388413 RepID=A3I0Y1_9BACT|nr:DUF2264 domain-containing protein [Algoriphagus machipongonensis]EAZ80127.1 putative Tat (twin-arginine translocation) pathway signal sequence containing protein [Algoriphagus machipongonensis]